MSKLSRQRPVAPRSMGTVRGLSSKGNRMVADHAGPHQQQRAGLWAYCGTVTL